VIVAADRAQSIDRRGAGRTRGVGIGRATGGSVAELESELESLLIDFTEDYPRIKDIRMELDLLKAESDRVLSVKPADSGRLTLALGKLILGKLGHSVALKRLLTQYQDGHPSVKKEKRQVEIFEAAIKEILG